MAVMRRWAAPVVVLALLLAGCGGDDTDKPRGAATTAAAQEPPEVPKDLEPVWLVRATGTTESASYEAWDQALFVDGDIAVYAVYDKALGVSLEDGSTVWSTPIDFHGELPTAIGRAATADHHWHVTARQPYEAGEGKSGERLYTIDVRDGTVVNDIEIDSYPYADILTVDGADYLALDEFLYRITERGVLETVWTVPRKLRKKRETIQDMAQVQGTSTITLEVSLSGNNGPTYFGFDTEALAQLWSRRSSELKGKPRGLEYETTLVADGRYVAQRLYRGDAEWVHLWVLDPATGATRAHHLLEADRFELEHEYRLWGTVDAGNPYGVQPVGDHLILADGHTVVRFDPIAGKQVWVYPYEENWGLGPLSGDGRWLYLNSPGATSGSILVLDAATGQQLGGWTVPGEHVEGLVSHPLIVPTEDGLVLGRNQSVQGDDYEEYDGEKPSANLNDVGFFSFTY